MFYLMWYQLCISLLGRHEQWQSHQERWRREACQSEYQSRGCKSIIDSLLCCRVTCYSPCLSGVFGSLHGDERQDRSQRRAGLHCRGQVWDRLHTYVFLYWAGANYSPECDLLDCSWEVSGTVNELEKHFMNLFVQI